MLNLGLPFLHFQPRLAMLDGDGRINYTRFLERYKIEMKEGDASWQDAVVQSVCEKLYDMCANVTEVYHRFDANHDGFIEYEEFVRVLRGLGVGLTDRQAYELMRTVDVNEARRTLPERAGKIERAALHVTRV